MNLQELKKIVEEKLTLKDGEWEELVTTSQQELKELGVKEDQLDKAVVSKVFATLRKQLMSNANVYEGIIFGAGSVTDFGAQNKYNKTKEMWDLGDADIRQSMVEKGEVNKEGEPLWCAENTNAKFKYQDQDGNLKESSLRKIEPEKEKQKPLIGIFGIYKEGEPTEYKKAYITLWSNKIDIDIPKYKLCKVRLNGKINEEEDAYRLNSASVTEFLSLKDEALTYEEYSEILDKYFVEETIDLDKDEDSIKLAMIADKRIVFIKSAIPVRCTETDKKSNVMDIGSTKLGFDDNGLITCWVPKTELLPPEGLGEIIVCGNPMVNEEKISLNLYGIFSTFKIEKPQAIPLPKNNEEGWGIK